MKTIFLRYWGAVLALAAALALLCGRPCLGGNYERLADELVKTAKTEGLSRLVMNNFAAQGRAGQEEAREAQLRLSEALFKLPGIGVMDATVLEKLKERGRRWAQVLIKGEVYSTETGAVLVVKTIDLRSGRRLAIIQISAGEEAQSPVPKDFRDAPGDIKRSACAEALEQLKDTNIACVELKARYWAARVREPGFSYSGLDSAPGSELRDYATLQKFYTLFNAYYEKDGPIIIPKTERLKLNTLMEKEAMVRNECPDAR